MFDKHNKNRMPESVEEAAELLLSDLLLQHLQSLCQMGEKEFNMLCEKIAPYLLDEFKIWQGNDALLASCFNNDSDDDGDPARIILKRVRHLVNDFHGFLVIT